MNAVVLPAVADSSESSDSCSDCADIDLHRDDAVWLITRLALTLVGFTPPVRPAPPPPPLFLFGTLPNGAAIRGTGRLRKLRPSAVTRRF